MTETPAVPRMPETARFIEALQHLDATGSQELLLPLFGEASELQSLSRTEQGGGAPDRFWTRYRQQFDAVRTTFERVIESDDAAVLVWASEGTLANGRPITYDGVSILSFADGRIARFETIYDSAAFMPQAAATRAG